MMSMQPAGSGFSPMPGWKPERGRGWFVPCLGAAAAALFVVLAVVVWTHGWPIVGVVLAVFGVALGWLLVSTKRRASSELSVIELDGEWGLLVPVRPMSLDILACLFVLALVFFAGAAALVYVTIDQEEPLDIIGVFLLGGLGWLLWKGGSAAFGARRREHLGIGLTPTRVIVYTTKPVLTVPWERMRAFGTYSVEYSTSGFLVMVQNWIAVTVDDPTRLPQANKRAAMLTRRFAPGVVAVLTTKQLAVDAQRALDVLCFYLDNEQERGELGTDRVLARFDQ